MILHLEFLSSGAYWHELFMGNSPKLREEIALGKNREAIEQI